MAASSVNEKLESSQADTEKDKELDELLISALNDFDEPNKHHDVTKTTPEADPSKIDVDSISDVFTEQFSDEMAKEFEDAMKSFLKDDPHLFQQFEKLAESAGTAGESEVGKKGFEETLKETLESLAKNTENLQDAGASGKDEMTKLFAGMGLDGDSPDDSFMPIMQTMMKTLLSRDVLYPSMQEISEKYPEWLAQNKTKLKENEYTNYEKQHKIIKEILAEFDKEKPTDNESIKKDRSDKIMDLMQKMQDLGQPPKEIVGDMVPGLDFDENGIPKFPGSPESCCVM